MSKYSDLAKLLMNLFTVDELRAYLHGEPDGEAILQGLRVGPVTPATFFPEVVEQIERHHSIDEGFFDRLVEKRPHRVADIHKVRDRFQRPDAARVPPPCPPDPHYAERIAVLETYHGFLSSDARVLSLVAATGAGKSQFLRARYTERVAGGAPVALVDLEPCRDRPSSRVALLRALLQGLRHLLSPMHEDEVRASLLAAATQEPAGATHTAWPQVPRPTPTDVLGSDPGQMMSDPDLAFPVTRSVDGGRREREAPIHRDMSRRAQELLLEAAHGELVLYVDAVEAISAETGSGMPLSLDVLLNQVVPGLEARGARIVLAGQVLLKDRCAALAPGLMIERPFPDELTDAELAAALPDPSLLDQGIPDRRWRFPMLLGLASRLADQGRLDLARLFRGDEQDSDAADWDLIADAVPRILAHVGDPWLGRVLGDGCVLRMMSLDALTAVLGSPAPLNALELLGRWANVRRTTEGGDAWVLHPHLRAILHEALQRQRPEDFARLHARALEHFERLARGTDGGAAATVEVTYHQLGAAPRRWLPRLQVAFAVWLVAGDAATCEALLRCVEDEPLFRHTVERHAYARATLRRGIAALGAHDASGVAEVVRYLLDQEAIATGLAAEPRATLHRFAAERRLEAADLDAARLHLDSARMLAPDHPEQLRLDLAVLEKQDPFGALRYLEGVFEGLGEAPAPERLNVALAFAIRQEAVPWLVDRLRGLSRRFPEDGQVGLTLASAMTMAGRPFLAVQTLDAAVARGCVVPLDGLRFRAELRKQLGDEQGARQAWMDLAASARQVGEHELLGDALHQAGAQEREAARAWAEAVKGETPSISALRKLVQLALKADLTERVEEAISAVEHSAAEDGRRAALEAQLRLALREGLTLDLDPLWSQLEPDDATEAAFQVANDELEAGQLSRAVEIYRAIAARTVGEARVRAQTYGANVLEWDLSEPTAAFELYLEVVLGEVIQGDAALGLARVASGDVRAPEALLALKRAAHMASTEERSACLQAYCLLLCQLDRFQDATAALLACPEGVDRVATLAKVGGLLRQANAPQRRDRWWDDALPALIAAPRDTREARRAEVRSLVRGAHRAPNAEQIAHIAALAPEDVDADLRERAAELAGLLAGRDLRVEAVVEATGRYLRGAKQDLVLAWLGIWMTEANLYAFALDLLLRGAAGGYAHAAEALERAAELCHLHLRQPAQAAELVDRALALQPDRRSALVLGVRIACRAVEMGKVAAYLERLDAIQWTPEDAERARRARATWLVAQGALQDAVTLLAVETDVHGFDARVQAITAWLRASGLGPRADQIQRACEDACASRWPDHPLGRLGRLAIALRRKEQDLATELLEALEGSDVEERVAPMRQLWRVRAGQRSAVLAQLRPLEGGALDARAATELAGVFYNLDAKREALDLYRVALEQPGALRPICMLRVGELSRDLDGDLHASRRVLEQAVQEFRDDPGLWYTLQRTLVRQGDYARAKEVVDEEARCAGDVVTRDLGRALIEGVRGDARAAAQHMLTLLGSDRFPALLQTVQERIAEDGDEVRAAAFQKAVLVELARRDGMEAEFARLEWFCAMGDLEAAEAHLCVLEAKATPETALLARSYRAEILVRTERLEAAIGLVRAEPSVATLNLVVTRLCAHAAHGVAADLCERVAALRGPEEADAWRHAGLSAFGCAQTTEEWARGAAALERSLALNPDDQRAWDPLILAYVRLRQDQQADAAMRRWVNHGYRLRTGDTYTPHALLVDLACGRSRDAACALVRATRNGEALSQVLVHVGQVLVRLQRPELNLSLRDALAREIDGAARVDQQLTLTQLRLAANDLEVAEQSLAELSAQAPPEEERVVRMMRVMLLARRRRPEEAAQTLGDNSPVPGVDDPIQVVFHQIYQDHGPDQAVRFLEAMAQLPGVDPAPLLVAASEVIEQTSGVSAARRYLADAHAAHPGAQGLAFRRIRLLSRLRAWDEADAALALLSAQPSAPPLGRTETEGILAYADAARGRVLQALRRVVRAQPGLAGIGTLQRLAEFVGQDGHPWGPDLMFHTFEYFSDTLVTEALHPLATVRHHLERGDLDTAEAHIGSLLQEQETLEHLDQLLLFRGVVIALRGETERAVHALNLWRGGRDHLGRIDRAIALLTPLPHGKAPVARLLELVGRRQLREGPGDLVRAAEFWREAVGDVDAARHALDMALAQCRTPAERWSVEQDRLLTALRREAYTDARRIAETLDDLAQTDAERDLAQVAMITALVSGDEHSRAAARLRRLGAHSASLHILSRCARLLWRSRRTERLQGLFERLGVPGPASAAALDAVSAAWRLAADGDANGAVLTLLDGRTAADAHGDIEALAQGLHAANMARAAAEVLVASGRLQHPTWREDWLEAIRVLRVAGEEEGLLDVLRRASREADGVDVQMKLCGELVRRAARAEPDQRMGAYHEAARALTRASAYLGGDAAQAVLLFAAGLARREADDLSLAEEIADGLDAQDPGRGLSLLEKARVAEARGAFPEAERILKEALHRERDRRAVLEGEPEPTDRVLAGLLMVKLGRLASAEQELSALVATGDTSESGLHARRLVQVLQRLQGVDVADLSVRAGAGRLTWMSDLTHDVRALRDAGHITLEQYTAVGALLDLQGGLPDLDAGPLLPSHDEHL